MINDATPPENVTDIDFEKQKIQNDIDHFRNSGKLPDTLTSRKFLIQYNNIYECVLDWSKKLGTESDSIWTDLIDSYIDYARANDIANAADILRQLEKETRNFFNSMNCKTYKFLTTVIKGDSFYNSHIFSLSKELEFITPKVKYSIALSKMEKFKIDLYINHQVEIMENINQDLKRINDIIMRYNPYTYLTWTESMYVCLQFRSNLDHVLQSYISAGEAINANLPFRQK
jgi:hypothetical protein